MQRQQLKKRSEFRSSFDKAGRCNALEPGDLRGQYAWKDQLRFSFAIIRGAFLEKPMLQMVLLDGSVVCRVFVSTEFPYD